MDAANGHAGAGKSGRKSAAHKHIKIPTAIFEALENGEIDKTQFEILVLCYRWVNVAAGWRVDSYSAERSCHTLGLDATQANLKRFQRALRDLVERGIVRYDYKLGKKRTYHVWLPPSHRFERIGTTEENILVLWGKELTKETRVSLSRASVYEFVSDEDDTSPCANDDYREYAGNCVSGPVFILSSTNQEGKNLERKIPLNPPGDLPLSVPRGGEAQMPPGSAPPPRSPCGGVRTGERREPLTSEQVSGLNRIVGQFRVLWAKHHGGFDPDAGDVFNLLKECSPLEVLSAYRHVLDTGTGIGPTGRLPNRALARFFAKSAQNTVEVKRSDGTQLNFVRVGWEDIEIAEVYALEQSWRKLFDSAMPFIFRNSYQCKTHFYHPKLRRLLQEWEAANKSGAEQQHPHRAQQVQPEANEAQNHRAGEADWQRRASEARQPAAQQEAERQSRRAEVSKQLCKELPEWNFDQATGTLRAKYGITIQLNEDGSKAIITGTKGEKHIYRTDNLADIAYKAMSAD